MQQIWRILDMGFRAAVWKSTPNPPVVGLAAVAGWAALAMVIHALQQGLTAGGLAWWSPYGFNALTAFFALVLLATAFFFRPEVRATALCAFLVFWIVTDLVSIAYEEVVFIFTGTTWELKSGLWSGRDYEDLVFIVHVVWWFGAMLAIFRSVDPEKFPAISPRSSVLPRSFSRSFLFCRMIRFSRLAISKSETRICGNIVRAVRNGDREKETPTRTVASAAEAARVERSQPALLEQGAASLSPQRPGVADVYVVGVSGWADQEVFRKELDGAFDAVSRSLGTEGRMLKLVNDPDTVAAVADGDAAELCRRRAFGARR